MTRAGRPLLLPLLGLLLLQGCDLLLTWRLLSGGWPDVYEANPLAAALLARFGWAGLALLKSGCSALIVLAVLAVARRRPVVARRLLGGLCLLLLGVVGYSGWLLLRPDPHAQEMSQLRGQAAELDHHLASLRRLDRERQLICLDILQGRSDLPAGVRRMSAYLAEKGPDLASSVQACLPEADRLEDVAAFLYFHASRLIVMRQATDVQLGRLDQQMRRVYPDVPRIDTRTYSGRTISWKETYRLTQSALAAGDGPR